MDRSKQTTFITIAVAILFVLVLFFLYLNFQKTSSVTKTIPIPIPTLVLHPTDVVKENFQTDWKTYVNYRQNYQVQYPSDYSLTENTLIRAFDNQNQDIVSIDLKGNTPRVEIDSNNELNLKVTDVKKFTISTQKIDNLTTYLDQDEDEGGGQFNNYYFVKNSKIFRITFINYPDDKEKLDKTKILSTFQFL